MINNYYYAHYCTRKPLMQLVYKEIYLLNINLHNILR